MYFLQATLYTIHFQVWKWDVKEFKVLIEKWKQIFEHMAFTFLILE